MAARGPESKINHQQLAKIARVVLQYLENNKKAYDTEGLLRIADTDKTLADLTKALVRLKDDPKSIHNQITLQKIGSNALSPHSYVGVLKRVFRENGKVALVSTNRNWENLRRALQETDFDNPAQVQTCLKTFNQAISNLANSPSEQDRDAAEVIYTLLHIATKISARSENNKMHPKNCAIVIGPSLGDALAPPSASDPLAMVSLMQRANQLAEALIASQNYALPFREAINYLGLTPHELQETNLTNTDMMKKITAQFKAEMKKGTGADQALIKRLNENLQDLSRRKGILDRLSSASKGIPVAASSSSPSFTNMGPGEQNAYVNKLLELAAGKNKDALKIELAQQGQEDLKNIHTELDNTIYKLSPGLEALRVKVWKQHDALIPHKENRIPAIGPSSSSLLRNSTGGGSAKRSHDDPPPDSTPTRKPRH